MIPAMGPIGNTTHPSLLAVLLTALFLLGCLSVAAAGNDPLIFDSYGRPVFLGSSITNNHREFSRRTEDGGSMDCYDALIYADADYNRKVNQTEYLTFLNLYGPTDFLPESVQSFDDLPLVFKSNFLILACLCLQQPGAEEDCCVGDSAYISNLGAAPDETPTPDQEEYLSQVCFLTETSIVRYVASSSPTTSPVQPVAPTPAPFNPIVTPSPIEPSTDSPSASPSVATTDTPTDSPSKATTTQPSGGPTFPPTASPTAAPTPVSTGPVPTTSLPTMSPVETTLGPTGGTTPDPTGISDEPSSAPSSKPGVGTPTPTNAFPAVDMVAQTTYIIAMQADATVSRLAYRADLRSAMDLLAPQVAANMTVGDAGRLLQQLLRARQRRLSGVTVDLPTSVDGIIATVCPDIVPDDDRCEDVSASIGLYLEESGASVNETSVKVAFENDLNAAIEGGALQEALNVVNPDSPVYIVTADGGVPNDDDTNGIVGPGDDSSRELSGGAISGIVIGGMAGILVVVALLSRRQQNNDAEEYYLKENQSVDVEELTVKRQGKTSSTPPAPAATPPVDNQAGMMAGVALGAVVGAAAVSKSRKSKDSKKIGVDSTAAMASAEKADSDAGSSGWSSREGMSSLESAADDETRGSSRGGASSAAQSASQLTTLASSETPDAAEGANMTYTELDQAIQKGDWAAVGVTAALLASQSQSSTQDSSPEKRVNFQQGEMSETRAAELDSLVEAGDWAGVVAAAAKYDAQETAGSIRSGSRTSEAGSSAGSVGSSGTGRSAFSGSGTAITAGSGVYNSTGTTTSDTNSRVKKLDEIRAEVEQLVDKVVPEEKDNIDEMMMQFRGREEELVETLRTMQEREVAQKARVEGQKRAKRDARQAVEQNKFVEKQTVAAAIAKEDSSWIREIDDTPADPEQVDEAPVQQEIGALTGTAEEDEDDEDKQVSELQGALKQAIDSEDWEKVAETAAGLSGRFDDNAVEESDASTNATDRSQEINALVDKGDWDGVVAAASKELENDKSESSADSEFEAERRAKRQQRLKEEQEALEQADIWSAIAEQTKKDSAEAESEANQAATVAADWAIARSLSELKAADESGRLSDADAGSSDSSNSGGSNGDDQEGTI